MHLVEAMRPIAAACADAPRKMLRILDDAATEQVLQSYPQFEHVHEDVHVRITGLPVDDSIRDLRCEQQRYWPCEGMFMLSSGVTLL